MSKTIQLTRSDKKLLKLLLSAEVTREENNAVHQNSRANSYNGSTALAYRRQAIGHEKNASAIRDLMKKLAL